MPRRSLYLSGDPEADALLTKDPLALLIGMVLDQQVLLELAFSSPAELVRRLGRPLSAADIASMDPAELAELFARRPSLHRYPGSMAARVQALCALIVDEYGGDPAAIWKGARDGEELVARIEALPGFGKLKARIFAALLGKQLGVTVPGWREASSPFGDAGTHLSVADIVDPATKDEVREHKRQMKAAAKAAAGKGATPKARSRPAAARP